MLPYISTNFQNQAGVKILVSVNLVAKVMEESRLIQMGIVNITAPQKGTVEMAMRI